MSIGVGSWIDVEVDDRCVVDLFEGIFFLTRNESGGLKEA